MRPGNGPRTLRAGAGKGPVALILVAALAAGCGNAGPNLDEAVAGHRPASIRAAIVRHLNWGDRLTAAELDDLATFIAETAGTAQDASGTGDVSALPGKAVWTANECGSCHVLGAAEGSS